MRRSLATALLGCLSCVLGACGHVGYTGEARELARETLQREDGWLHVERVPLLRQHGRYDCGPTALAMVLSYWFPSVPAKRWTASVRDDRASASQLRDRARALGLASFVVEGTFKDIAYELSRGRPVIVGTAKPTTTGAVAHYEVVVGLHLDSRRIATLDPGAGLRQNSLIGFLSEWQPTGRLLLVVLPREPATLARYRDRQHPVALARAQHAHLRK